MKRNDNGTRATALVPFFVEGVSSQESVKKTDKGERVRNE